MASLPLYLMVKGMGVTEAGLRFHGTGGPVPQTPWDLSLLTCPRRSWPGGPSDLARPPAVRKAPDRRSGRFPALPYPPLEQKACFPFPFPLGSIERETGNDSLS